MQDLAALSPPDQPAAAGAPRPARTVGIPVAAPAAATLTLYAGDWAGFVAWCRQQGRASLPASADTLAAFLLAAAPRLSRGALGRRRAAIGAMHRQAGLAVPQLDAASRKALRLAAKPAVIDPPNPAPTATNLVRSAARCSRDLAGLRDRALLLLAAATRPQVRPDDRSGPASAPRRFLLALEAEDVRFTATGAVLQLRTRIDEPTPSRMVTLTRAAQVGACPVRALEDWLRSSDTTFGPVFRKVDRWGNVEHARLGPDAWYRILARRSGIGGPRRRPTRAG